VTCREDHGLAPRLERNCSRSFACQSSTNGAGLMSKVELDAVQWKRALEADVSIDPNPQISRYTLVLRIIALCLLYGALITGGAYFGSVVKDLASIEFSTIHMPNLRLIVAITAFIFALASALPFVPGAEIGFGMLVLLGGNYAPLVYACMLCALMLAFMMGRFIPMSALAKGFAWLNFTRASHLIEAMAVQAPEQRLQFLLSNAPNRFAPFLLRYRYLALVVLLNTPGNSLIGGGGGIALIAGLSGVFKWYYFAITMALAIAPIPIAFYLMS
jgi:hypothetical protein